MNFQQKRLLDLANKCVNFGKYDYVKIILVRLLQNNTNNAEILSEISNLYIRMRRYDKAMSYARRAFELEKSVETLEALANACNVNKNYQDAAIMFEELTKYKKEEIIYYYCQRAYKNLGLEEEGIRVLEEGAKEFKTPALYGTIMFEYLELGMDDKSKEWLDKLKKEFPNNAITENSLGFYYEASVNDYEQAKKHFLKAAKMGYIDGYYNLGVCCKHSEDYAGAEKYLRKLHSIKKRVGADYNYTLGSIYMAQKKMKLGYKYYSEREPKQYMNYRERKNYWDGKDYPNEVLYITSEQGYGDNIQFSRFVPYVAKKFKKVYYAVDESLYDLFKRSFKKYKNVEIIKFGVFKPYNKFLMIMDIQNLLNISYHNIPQQEPYIITDEEKDYNDKIQFFRGDELKIGLNWRAKGMGLRDAVYRTIDAPYYFKKLFELEGNKYYSFQMNDIFGMCEKYPQIVDLEEHIQTFDDTASLLKNLDVLITVDTALAHLAGALGVKTYLLLCKAPDWRWFDNDKKTEWYPSVTIIKQHDRRTWEDVAEELFNEIAGKGAEARAKRE